MRLTLQNVMIKLEGNLQKNTLACIVLFQTAFLYVLNYGLAIFFSVISGLASGNLARAHVASARNYSLAVLV
jgi:hypothetical protein